MILQTPTKDDIVTTTQVLLVVGALLNTVVTALIIWLVKTTSQNKEKLDRIDVVLFGERGGPGAISEITAFRKDEESLRRTMQRVLYRLGEIEDKLKIPRNTTADKLRDMLDGDDTPSKGD